MTKRPHRVLPEEKGIPTMRRSLRFTAMHLSNIGRFSDFDIEFEDGINVICGSNGVGKTTVLDAVAASILQWNQHAYIRRRANYQGSGSIRTSLVLNGEKSEVVGSIDAIMPEKKFDGFGVRQAAPLLIYVRPSRDFDYVRKDSIKRDKELSDFEHQNNSYAGVSTGDIKDWFANRYLMRPHGDNWPDYRKNNLNTAIMLFGILDPTVTLYEVDTSTFDINVRTPAGIIPFEYLSSGFRSSYAMLLGIIKEIEYRQLEVSASEFAGVILVDEIDLHLHPTWQAKILDVFRNVFTNAQIIVTTHSPHVVQSAKSNEVLAITISDNGEPYCLRYGISKYGFAGWSLEEILEDVMGVNDTTSTIYRDTVSEFEKAIELENDDLAIQAYEQLMMMLHPNSPLRKVFTLQASPLIDPSPIADRLRRLQRD